jgi:hypothetical protein
MRRVRETHTIEISKQEIAELLGYDDAEARVTDVVQSPSTAGAWIITVTLR